MPTHSEHLTDDKALLSAIVAAVQAAGSVMQSRFSVETRLGSREEVVAAIYANDEASLVPLREALTKARPSAGWVEDELEGGALPPGEWWITDPSKGTSTTSTG
jgi:myo-inositol-1(or 4)-monophosphatase